VADSVTIVRIRGSLTMGLSSVASALDGFSRVGVGLCIVSENAFGVGVTAVPSPIVDIAWDGWIWYNIGDLAAYTTTLTNSHGSQTKELQIDSKAMRKIKNTDVLIAVLETAAEVGTAVFNMTLNTRVLLKLP